MKIVEHEHPLNLIDLQPKYPHYEEPYDDEEDLIKQQNFQSPCDLCGQEINFLNRYYYECDECKYSLHKLCAEVPKTLQHKSHGDHTLNILSNVSLQLSWQCQLCKKKKDDRPIDLRYRCFKCYFDICLDCAKNGIQQYHVIYHPCHQHPLVPIHRQILAYCDACGSEHKGIFYQCTTCFGSFIHSDCVFRSRRLLIQLFTYYILYHTHPLSLTYSFPIEDERAKYYTRCRVCDARFTNEKLWVYRCEQCRYYVHIDCVESKAESFTNTFLNKASAKHFRTFHEADHPGLLKLPFPDQSCTILKHLFYKEKVELSGTNLEHSSHQHPLILVDERPTPSRKTVSSLHNPMKKVKLLCNGCLKPIMDTPFYMCAYEDQRCNYVLHEWCTRLPVQLENHAGHPQHTLILMPNKSFNVFYCNDCLLPCNGFAYSCVKCGYYIDVCCGFIPEKITHKSHPNHLLLKVENKRLNNDRCRMCLGGFWYSNKRVSFSCLLCDFHLHPVCAFLLPEKIRHQYDKHHMNLRYAPVENHKGDYFCEKCEEEFDPNRSFYHCDICVQSMHSACAPLILQHELANPDHMMHGVYAFLNIKFGGIHTTEVHPHPLSFLLGIKSDGRCPKCNDLLQNTMILKCLECTFAIHYRCCKSIPNARRLDRL